METMIEPHRWCEVPKKDPHQAAISHTTAVYSLAINVLFATTFGCQSSCGSEGGSAPNLDFDMCNFEEKK